MNERQCKGHMTAMHRDACPICNPHGKASLETINTLIAGDPQSSIPILMNHDFDKVIGIMKGSVITFDPAFRPTRAELFSIFGNCGFRALRMFIGDDGVERFERIEVMEFSYARAG